ncbi:MAG: hypothetical protein LUE16_05805 [Lachnospiraceae bacterium]|nr:hypothetical protein [Lachnospiraceae bacterium]
MVNKIKSFFGDGTKYAFPILFLYLLLYFILLASSNSCAITKAFWIFLGLISLGFSILILSAAKKIGSLKLKSLSYLIDKTSYLQIICVFLISLIVFLFYFSGSFTEMAEGSDVYVQYSQAIGQTPYSNWHPVLHTLLFFTLPLKVIEQYSFIVILQLVYFCLAFTYLIFVLRINGAPRLFLACLCIYIWLNPFLAPYMMSPLKDIAMMIFAILLLAYYIQIICSKAAWLQKKRNLLLFSLVSVACGFMRHNAVLFVAPLVLIVLFYAAKDKKIRFSLVATILITVFLVKGIYLCLNVESPSQRKVETIGLPLTIWCNVMQTYPSSLPTETQLALYDLIPEEFYDSFYLSAGFNSIKWNEGMNLDKIDALSYAEVLKYTYQCFRYDPKGSLEALASLTSFVWKMDISDSVYNPLSDTNEAVFPAAATFVRQLATLFGTGFWGSLFGSYGLELFLMLITGVILLVQNRMSILHVLPFFCYDFGTMLLLTGRDYRFFLFNIPLWLPVLFLMLRDDAMFHEIFLAEKTKRHQER